MWYAQRSKDRQEKDVNLLPTLSMDASQVRNVGRMLDSLDEKDYSSRGTKRPEHRAGASYQPEPDDDLSDEWDKRISSIVKKEFKDGKLRYNFSCRFQYSEVCYLILLYCATFLPSHENALIIHLFRI